MLLIYDGHHASAVPILERILLSDPTNLLARRDLGSSYLELHQYTKAIEQLQHVVLQAPGDYMAQFELGVANEHLGRRQEAEKHITSACRIAPEAAQCTDEMRKVHRPE
jgi:Flp pilus assembly protein TadD